MTDKEPKKESKPEKKGQVIDIPDIPETKYTSDLSCPPGFDPEKWKRKGDGFKRNYYKVVGNQKPGDKK